MTGQATTACDSLHWHGLSSTRRRGATTPGLFRDSRSVWRFIGGCPRAVGACLASKLTEGRNGGGVALQRCWHGRSAQCVTPRGGSTELRSSLVHTDVFGAATSGDAFHDLCPTA